MAKKQRMLNDSEISNLNKNFMGIFREAGCKLFVPQNSPYDFAISNASGNLAIAPESDDGILGWSNYDTQRKRSRTKWSVDTGRYITPHTATPNTDFIYIRGENGGGWMFYIFETRDRLESDRGIMFGCQERIIVPYALMKEFGVVEERD